MTKTKKPILALLAGLLLLIAGAASAQNIDYTPYSDQSLGFSCQLPSHWLPQSKPPATLIFSGPAGSEQFYTTINAQLIHNAKSNLAAQEQEFLRQISGSPQYRLVSRQSGNLSGQRGTRLVVEYQLPENQQMFRQEQFVVDRAPYYFWLAYTAPADLFDKHHPIMDRAVGSLKFLPLGGNALPTTAGQLPTQGGQPPAPGNQPAPPAQTPYAPAVPQPQANQEPRIYDIKTATGLDDQGPVGVTSVFPASAQQIYVYFRFRGLASGTELRSEWYHGDPGRMRKLAEATTKVQDASISWGHFNLTINPGNKFPVGAYQVNIYVGNHAEATVNFRVR